MLDAIGSVIGGLIDNKSAKKESDRQYDLARNTIKYRVEDAKNAGIHPLYALGAQGMSSSVVSSNMGQSIADAGSQLGKAYVGSYEKQLQAKNLQKMDADIKATESQSRANDAQAVNYIEEAKRNSDLARLQHQLRMGERQADQVMYKRFYNQRTGKYEWLPNKETGLEMPETIGLGYYGAGQAEGEIIDDIGFRHEDFRPVKKWQKPKYWEH